MSARSSRSPACDGWYDADRIPVLGARILFVEEAYILIIQINIHKTADSSLIGVEMLAQLGKAACQTAERLTYRSRATFNARLPSGELAERRRNQDLYGHTVISPLIEHLVARDSLAAR